MKLREPGAVKILPTPPKENPFDGVDHLEKRKACGGLILKRGIPPWACVCKIKCVRAAGDYERLKTCQAAALNADAGEGGFDSDV